MKNKFLSSLAFISLLFSLSGCEFATNQQGVRGPQGEQGEPGKDGEDGTNGKDGEDGVTPEFKVEDGILYVSYDNGDTWTKLGNVSGEDGKDGEDGTNGKDGKDGVTPEFKVEDGILYVSYDKGDTWTSLGNVSGEDGKDGEDGTNGDDGLSAYEIFLKYHPEYTGSEEDWINDVASGNTCNLFGHEWDEGVITTPAKEGVNGEKTYSCANCDEHKYEVIPMIKVYANAEIYEVDGVKYVNYGSYPQTHVGDETLISELNELTETNYRGYYEYNGKEYAKITAKPYHYGSYTDEYGETKYHQYTDGSKIEGYTTEWFNVEPIKWRIISENEDGSYQLYSEYLLDARSYCGYDYVRKINEVDIYQNNYKYSNIRAWLNGYNGTEYKIADYTNKGFYDRAFKEEEKGAIVTIEVDNSASTMLSSPNEYACENTYDKIYLLSYKDMYNTSYGFTDDESRYAQVTDYVKANGAYWDYPTQYFNNGYYLLRSPNDSISNFVNYVNYRGRISTNFVNSAYCGVRVACNINLE